MQNNNPTTRNLKPANNNDNDKAAKVCNEGIQEPNKQHNIFETTDIPDLDSGTISKGKLASGKYQHLAKLLSKRKDHTPLDKPDNPET